MSQKKKIVLIDDEKDFCDMLKLNLEDTEKFTVVTTSDPTEAAQLCKDEKPDVVLLDIVMPQMNGLEVIKMLKSQKETEKIPIIVASGVGEKVYLFAERATTSFSADSFVQKPFSTEALVETIYSTIQEI